METLTVRQKETYEWLYAFWLSHGYPPTVREIKDAFGLSSTKGVVDILAAIERKGWITSECGSARTLVPVEGLKMLQDAAGGADVRRAFDLGRAVKSDDEAYEVAIARFKTTELRPN